MTKHKINSLGYISSETLLVIIACTLAAAFGCSTAKIQKLDTEIATQGAIGNQMIGIDTKGNAVVQEEITAEAMIREIRWSNADLSQSIVYKHKELDRCRDEIADPRLGGNGDITEIPELDATKLETSVSEQFGMRKNGDLIILKKQSYQDRLNDERKYEASLKQLDRLLNKHLSKCMKENQIARVKSGLPAKRFSGVGKFNSDGSYSLMRAQESNIDDAFKYSNTAPAVREIMAPRAPAQVMVTPVVVTQPEVAPTKVVAPVAVIAPAKEAVKVEVAQAAPAKTEAPKVETVTVKSEPAKIEAAKAAPTEVASNQKAPSKEDADGEEESETESE